MPAVIAVWRAGEVDPQVGDMQRGQDAAAAVAKRQQIAAGERPAPGKPLKLATPARLAFPRVSRVRAARER